MTPSGARRVVVVGADGEAVARRVRQRREAGERVAGFVGEDRDVARAMAEEMLGGVDELEAVPRRPEGDDLG